MSVATFEGLLEAELSIDIFVMSEEQYLFVVLMHFIQNRPIEGRFALLRALEMYNQNVLFKALINVADALCDGELTLAMRALAEIEFPMNIDALDSLVKELKNRLVARRLLSLQRAFTSIRLEHLSEMFSLSEEDVHQILNAVQWPVSSDNFVEPKDSEPFRVFLASLRHLEEYGGERDLSETVTGDPNKSGEVLKRLTACTQMLERNV